MQENSKIWHFLKITVLPQIKALEILFWPYFIIFSPKYHLIPFHRTEFSNSFCQRFFYSPFSWGSVATSCTLTISSGSLVTVSDKVCYGGIFFSSFASSSVGMLNQPLFLLGRHAALVTFQFQICAGILYLHNAEF